MLIKLFIDDTFPFHQVTGAATINWVIEDHKPLAHRDNVMALMRGINFPPKQGAGDFPGQTFIHISGRIIDMNKTASENHIAQGNTLAVSLTKPMAAHTPRSSRVQSQFSASSQGGGDNDDDDENDNDSENGGAANSSGQESPRETRSLSRKSSARSLASSANEEVYTASDVAWFPFIVGSGKVVVGKVPQPGSKPNSQPTSDSELTPRDATSSGGAAPAAASAAAAASSSTPGSPRTGSQPPQGPRHVAAPFTPHKITSVRVISAHEEPDVDEPEPRTIDLCPPCSKIVATQIQSNQAAMVPTNMVHVERHYRPMMIDTERVECWMEKLSTGTFARFQKRWFVITEKSMDYHEQQPTVDQRNEKSRGHILDDNGKCMIKRVIDAPKKGEFPSVEDSGAGKYFFVVELANKPKPQVFYAYTEEDRTRVCSFMAKIKRRAEQQGGSKRDPVLWKQWASSLLVSTSNLAETRLQKEDEAQALEGECQELQRQIEALKAGRGETDAQLQYHRGVVERLEKEAVAAHRKNAEQDRHIKEIRGAVEEKRHELAHTLGKSEDLSHRTRIIEQESINEKKRVVRQLAEIRDENSRLQHKIDALFGKWRKVEEHHVEAAFRPSTLSPADIAARSARDYEQRSMMMGATNSSRGGVGPMAPLTAETFTPKKGGGTPRTGASPIVPSPLNFDSLNRSGNSQQGGSTPSGRTPRITGSTMSSPNARLQGAVKDTLAGGGGGAGLPQGQTLKDIAKTGRITFGLSAALGFVPGSPDALSSSRTPGSRRM